MPSSSSSSSLSSALVTGAMLGAMMPGPYYPGYYGGYPSLYPMGSPYGMNRPLPVTPDTFHKLVQEKKPETVYTFDRGRRLHGLIPPTHQAMAKIGDDTIVTKDPQAPIPVPEHKGTLTIPVQRPVWYG